MTKTFNVKTLRMPPNTTQVNFIRSNLFYRNQHSTMVNIMQHSSTSVHELNWKRSPKCHCLMPLNFMEVLTENTVFMRYVIPNLSYSVRKLTNSVWVHPFNTKPYRIIKELSTFYRCNKIGEIQQSVEHRHRHYASINCKHVHPSGDPRSFGARSCPGSLFCTMWSLQWSRFFTKSDMD